MARALPQWARRLGKRRVDPFTRASRDGLDLLATPAYDMSEAIRTTLQTEVRELVQRLLPHAVDAYSGDALDDWIEARAEQLVARLDSEREERQAVWEALIGLAKEEATRRKCRYDLDVDNLLRAQHALDIAREALTQQPGIPRLSARPVPPDHGPIRSTLPKIDIGPGWTPEQSTRTRAGGDRPSCLRLRRPIHAPGNGPVDAHPSMNGSTGTNGSATTLTTARSHDKDDDADRH
jgi:hypothetical protein